VKTHRLVCFPILGQPMADVSGLFRLSAEVLERHFRNNERFSGSRPAFN
jgi:hypothetical protein